MINASQRPLILAGHASSSPAPTMSCAPSRERKSAHLDHAARNRRHSRVAPAQPPHDGYARRSLCQSGRAGRDLLIAVGMRFDDRVTGTLSTYARMPRSSTSRLTRRNQQECGRRPRHRGRREASAGPAHPLIEYRERAPGSRRSPNGAATPTPATSSARTTTARCMSPTSLTRSVRARRARRPPSSLTWASTRCGRPSTSATTSATAGSPPAGWAPWATACRRGWAPPLPPR